MFREHSITIGGKNTWDDWHLQPSSRPVVKPPTQKTNYIEIPGANGSLDLSDLPMGYPVYQNRQGEWEFIVENGFKSWDVLYSEILNYVHGKKFQVILEDDLAYYYEGRITVKDWKSNNNGTWSNIVLGYNLGPFKYSITSTCEDWLWDPFDFENDVINDGYFNRIMLTEDNEWVELDYSDFIGQAPVIPNFIVTSNDGNGVLISFYNSRLGDYWISASFPDGVSRIPDMVFVKQSPDDVVKIRIRGKGVVSVDFRRGSL